MKKPFTFRLDADLMEQIRKLAVKENRGLTNFIETIFRNLVKKKGHGKK